MKQRNGFYPRPGVDVAGSVVVSQAGGLLLTETIRGEPPDQADCFELPALTATKPAAQGVAAVFT